MQKSSLYLQNYGGYGTSARELFLSATYLNEVGVKSRRNFLFYQSFISSTVQRFHGGTSKNAICSTKKRPTLLDVNISLQIFCCCTVSRRDEYFLFLPKFHIFNGLKISWREKQNANFRTKKRSTLRAVQISFFRLNFVAHFHV